LRKISSSIVLLILGLGACAPAQTIVGSPPPFPPAAAPAPAPAPVPAPAPAPTADPSATPENWWLLDPTADRFLGTGAERAYRELLPDEPRRSVVVAIIDSGVDPAHEDLDDNLWVNEDEVAGNGVDDDRNGYVDDIHGWNFLGSPGGENVHHDTFEVTRLYAQCRERGELDTAPCRAIAADFEADRAEEAGILQQYRSIASTQAQITQILARQLGGAPVTRASVSAIQSADPQVQQARAIYLQMIDAGATPEVIAEGIESLASRVEYGFNPDFDPRPIVGDDYEDLNERVYGNSDVEGPAADHGTHVAGIVGAERGNGIGVEGIASGVELMVVRAVPDGDERDKDVANAIRYAVDNGADIINMSFGKGYSPAKEAVDAAVRHAQTNGVLIIHAAGNAGVDLDSENSFPNRFYQEGGEAELWIEVGASGLRADDGFAAPFSNYSRARVHVFAPGVEIYSTVPGNEYQRNDGTSMAAPVVSGLAALLMAYYPDLTAAQVKEIILESASRYPGQAALVPGGAGERRGFDQLSVTGGIVNAFEAVRLAEQASGSRR
jgi:subtilisin family serine protease